MVNVRDSNECKCRICEPGIEVGFTHRFDFESGRLIRVNVLYWIFNSNLIPDRRVRCQIRCQIRFSPDLTLDVIRI